MVAGLIAAVAAMKGQPDGSLLACEGRVRLAYRLLCTARVSARGADRDGAAEASRRVSRTAARVLEGYLAVVAVSPTESSSVASRRRGSELLPHQAVRARVLQLGARERLLCTPIVARSNRARNGITGRDKK